MQPAGWSFFLFILQAMVVVLSLIIVYNSWMTDYISVVCYIVTCRPKKNYCYLFISYIVAEWRSGEVTPPVTLGKHSQLINAAVG